ncbi:MAG TPA: phage tail tape measure protein [Pseudonocardiaceae bacterium]|nr:phage tail tape measure protein [Pseudonocardiaceae bacterium]
MVSTAAALAVAVYPTAKEFGPLLAKETIGPATEVGARTGRSFSDAFSASAARAGVGGGSSIAGSARQAQLAIEEASAKVVAARGRETDAAARVRLAETRLAEARERFAAGSSQVEAAELRLAAAQRTVAVRADSTALAEQRLSATRLDVAEATAASTTANDASAVSMGRLRTIMSDTSSTAGGLMSQVAKFGPLVGVALAADLGVRGVRAAAAFQTSQERLVTTAGELQSNLGKVGSGILTMAGQVGYSAQEISTGMYTVESAGFHGAAALTVMRASAQGAKEENADLGTVTDAVTSVMRDYHFGVGQAADVTSKLIKAVSDGKTNFQDLTGSLNSVLPKASAVGLSLQDVLGALAGMTLHGVGAQQAAQNLADAISHLTNPTLVMTKEMASLGLNSADLSKNLGKTGVQGIMMEIADAILKHMGPAGTTLLNAFNQSKVAAADATAEFRALPPNLQKVADAYTSGRLTVAQWRAAIRGMPADQQMLLTSWKTMTDQSHGFNAALKSGGVATQTFSQAMAKATGDSASMNVALMLTGENSAKVRQNIADIGRATTEAGGNVAGWADVQRTFNQRLAEMRAGFGAIVIQIGQKLIPVLTDMIGGFQHAVSWLSQNRVWIGLVASVIGGLVGPILAVRAAIMAWEAVRVVIMNLRVAMWLLNAAFLANPIVFIAVALAGLVAGIIYAYFHFTKFREIVDDIGRALKTAFLAVIHAIGDALSWVGGHLSEAGAAFKALYTVHVKPAVDAISGAVSWVVGHIVALWRTVTAPIAAEWHHITGELSQIWGELVQLWNATGGRLVNLISGNSKVIGAVFSLVWGHIATFFRSVWNVLSSIVGTALSFILGVLRHEWDVAVGIVRIAWDVIRTIIAVAWDIIKGLFLVEFAVIKAMVINFWDIVVGVFKIAWDVIKGVINLALDIIKGILRIFIDLVTGQWGKLWHDVKALVFTVLTDIGHIIGNILHDIGSTVENVLHNIGNMFSSIWHAISNTVLSILRDMWSGIKSILSDGVKLLGTILDGLKKAFGTPIEFVVRTVLNNGLIRGINDILHVVGLHIPLIPDPNLPTFATGGIVPGTGPVDSIHALLTPGEGVLVPQATRALGGKRGIDAINALYGAGGGPRSAGPGLEAFGLGGIVGDILGGIGHAAESAWHAVKNVTLGGLRIGAQGFFDHIVKPLVNLIPGGPGNVAKQLVGGMVNTAERDLLSFLGKKDASANAGAALGGSIPTPAHLAILTAALTADRIPRDRWGVWETGLNTLITRESGWNPTIANTTDINAKEGHPSIGLAQVIGPTFATYRNPKLPNSLTDGVANVAAAINYIVARYGDITHVQQADARLPAKGYDSGGYLPPGPSLVINGTRRPEPVLTETQWDSVRSRIAGGDTAHQYFITAHDPVSVAHEIERRERANMRAKL